MNLGIEYYKKESGESPVEEFIEKFPLTTQAKIVRTFELLESYGLGIGMPHIKSLIGIKGGWELRIKTGGHLFRFGFMIKGGKVIILHGFIKKSDKTEKKDLLIIKKRIKER